MNRQRKRKNKRSIVDKRMLHVAAIYSRYIIGNESWHNVAKRGWLIGLDFGYLCRFALGKFSPYVIGMKDVKLTTKNEVLFVQVQSIDGYWGSAKIKI